MKQENDILFHLFFKTITHLKHITNMNILDEANKIVNDRSEEKERAYGSFSEGMKRAAGIASGMTGKEITANDMFACMVALKFSRQSFNHKTDNMLDAVAYLGAWHNFIEEELEKDFKKDLESEIFPQTKPHIDATEELIKLLQEEIRKIKEDFNMLKSTF